MAGTYQSPHVSEHAPAPIEKPHHKHHGKKRGGMLHMGSGFGYGKAPRGSLQQEIFNVVSHCFDLPFCFRKEDGALMWEDANGTQFACPILGLTVDEICEMVAEKIGQNKPELFCAGDQLPIDMVAAVTVCLKDGTNVAVMAGQNVPDEIDGKVLVDETSGSFQFLPNYKKPIQTIYKAGDTLPLDMVGPVTIFIDGNEIQLSPGAVLPLQISGWVQFDPLTKCAQFSEQHQHDEPKRVLYCAGETLPPNAAPVTVILMPDFNTVVVKPGEMLPMEMEGVVFADCAPNGKSEHIFKPTPHTEIKAETFIPGSTLPADMVGTVEVCLTNGERVTLSAGDTVPGNTDGNVLVDEVNNQASFVPRPVKVLQIIYEGGDLLPAGMKGQLEVCLDNNELITVAGGDELPANVLGQVTYDATTGCASYSQGAIKIPEQMQTKYAAGEDLPQSMAGPVSVCMQNGATLDLMPGQTVPAGVDGCVIVGNKGAPVFVQAFKKPVPVLRTVFKPGDPLPAHATGNVDICLLDGRVENVQSNASLPPNTAGCVVVDPVNGAMAFTQNPVKPVDPQQELYKPGDVLPDNMSGTLTVCLSDDSLQLLAASSMVPVDMLGCIQVDEVTGVPAYIPPKLQDTDTDTLPEQELFKAGDILPDSMIGTVTVCLESGSVQVLSKGGTVPANIVGCIFIDEITDVPAYIPPKPDPVIIPEKVQYVFKGGENMPANTVGTLSVCLDNGSIVQLGAGSAIPQNINGSVVVDCLTGNPGYMQGPVKVPIVVPPEPPKQELFKAGDDLPAEMLGTVTVCVDGGGTVTAAAGATLPVNMLGCVQVDEVSNVAGYIPPKLEDTDTDTLPEQEIFKGGATLPAEMVGSVTVCLQDGSNTVISANSTVPASIVGCVFVDEVTNVAAYIPPKPEAIVVPPIPDPVKETYKAGDQLPATSQPIVVCLLNGTTTQVGSGAVLPADLDGCIQVDETDGTTAYYPPKAEDHAHISSDASISIQFDPVTNTYDHTVVFPTPDPEKETFKAGDTLPAESSPVIVCLSDGSAIQIGSGATLPNNMVGCVQVDEFDGTTSYYAPKNTHISSDGSVQIVFNPATGVYDHTVIRVDQVKELFCAGDVLPENMVGTVQIKQGNQFISLAANDEIPSDVVGCIFVDETDGTADCIPNKQEPTILEQELFKPGDNLPDDMLGSVTVCLDGGQLVDLEAGDEVPQNMQGCVIVDELTKQPAFTQKPVKVTNAEKTICDIEIVKTPLEHCVKGNVGDVFEFALTIINSGDQPLQNVSVTDYLTDGSVNSNATVVNSPIASLLPGEINTSVKIQQIITQEDIDLGYADNIAVVQGTAANGSIVKAADDASVAVYQEDAPQCDPVPIVASCDAVASFTDLSSGSNVTPGDLTATELERHQTGACIGNGICAIDFTGQTETYQLPPVSDPNNCVLMMLVTVFADRIAQGRTIIDNKTGGNFDAGTLLSTAETRDDSVLSFLYSFDPLANSAGDTIDITQTADGIVRQVYFIEVCAGSGPLKTSDFALGAIYTETGVDSSAADTPTQGGQFDMGDDCDAIYFGNIRHAVNVAGGPDENVDAPWLTFDNSGVIQTLSTNSYIDPALAFVCQLGSSFGVVPAGTGLTNWESTHNVGGRQATITSIPLACSSSPGEVTEIVEVCSLNSLNDRCELDSIPVKEMSASVDITATPGSRVCAVAMIDGVEIAGTEQEVNNLQGAQDLTETVSVSASVSCPTVTDGDTVNSVFSLVYKVKEGEGANSAALVSGSGSITLS